MKTISPETVRTIAALLDRYEQARKALTALSQQGVSAFYFEKPVVCIQSLDSAPPASWAEITGERVPALIQTFKDECDMLAKELKKHGVEA